MVEKKSLPAILKRLVHLPGRTPGMAFDGQADLAFAQLAPYRDGEITVGYYSGDSEWERHPAGDEIVMALEGRTTLVLLVSGEQRRIELDAGDLLVVPRGCWHRFEASVQLKILGVTPQPSEHRLDLPEA
jgi:mannose-6-phosphate isomerase-like protein (cupin superfamily)